jgi:hypothetical protein
MSAYRPRDRGVMSPCARVDREWPGELETQKKAPGSRPGSKFREEPPVDEGEESRVTDLLG